MCKMLVVNKTHTRCNMLRLNTREKQLVHTHTIVVGDATTRSHGDETTNDNALAHETTNDTLTTNDNK